MPTSLGAIDSVTVAGVPAYIYFDRSAVTNPNCAGGDQINVLSPFTLNGVASAPYAIAEQSLSPAFPYFDAQGHVAARHLDGRLVGPATLFPGQSTPTAAGETVILVAFGMGIPNNYVQGSAVPAPLRPLAASFLRYATDRILLTKPNTSCTIQVPASLRSDGVRDDPGMPFGFPSD